MTSARTRDAAGSDTRVVFDRNDAPLPVRACIAPARGALLFGSSLLMAVQVPESTGFATCGTTGLLEPAFSAPNTPTLDAGLVVFGRTTGAALCSGLDRGSVFGSTDCGACSGLG